MQNFFQWNLCHALYINYLLYGCHSDWDSVGVCERIFTIGTFPCINKNEGVKPKQECLKFFYLIILPFAHLIIHFINPVCISLQPKYEHSRQHVQHELWQRVWVCCVHCCAACIAVLRALRCCVHCGAACIAVLRILQCCVHCDAAYLTVLRALQYCVPNNAVFIAILRI